MIGGRDDATTGTGGQARRIFAGNDDVPALLEFLRPQHQYDGHCAWSFGTSLKAAYCSFFDFEGYAPLGELWRAGDTVWGLSQLCARSGAWRIQIAPGHRSRANSERMMHRCHALAAGLNAATPLKTVAYDSDHDAVSMLSDAGYRRSGDAQVYMVLDRGRMTPREAGPDIVTRLLDEGDAAAIAGRGLVQSDAFDDRQARPRHQTGDGASAWMHGNLLRHAEFAAIASGRDMIAVDRSGAVVGFAGMYLDPVHGIGELEPVGVRHACQGRGIGKEIVRAAVADMSRRGIHTVVVRTDAANAAAIGAYLSVGFTTVDRLGSYVRHPA